MKQYYAPQLVEYGTIASITGDFGVNGVPDEYLTPNGETIIGRDGNTGSINGCAQELGQTGLKCICTDNESC